MALECAQLDVAIAGRTLVRGLDLKLDNGDFVGLLGPNGVGKTLTLHTLAGLRAPRRGTVTLFGERLENLGRRQVARRLGVLLQHQNDAFPTTVLETAMLGGYARVDFWRWDGAEERAAASAALLATDLAGLEHRQAATLSGGERRRLALASVLVQDPDVMLLDEPLNHLDPLHQLRVLSLLRELAAAGKTIVATLHDTLLAARFTNRVVLLNGSGQWQSGATAELLTESGLERLYQTRFRRYRDGDEFVLVPDAPASRPPA